MQGLRRFRGLNTKQILFIYLLFLPCNLAFGRFGF